MQPNYLYEATVVNVVDGDTIDVVIDLGFRIRYETRLRLNGIDTPEKRGGTKEAGDAAHDYLIDTIAYYGLPQRVKTYKPDKYGRTLAELYVGSEQVHVNQLMVDEGHAVAYFGGARG